MNCEILDTVYVRSNGDIPCDCDKGETVLLGEIDHRDPAWDIQQVLTNPKYEHIRKTLSVEVLPWGDVCANCAWLRTHEPFSDNLSRKKIRKIQLEPSLACNLECPCCSNKTQRQTRSKPFLMEIEAFDGLLTSLLRNSYTVGEIEYCGQGDPLMHPRFVEFVRTARARYPHARQRVITNGNFEYRKVIGDEFVDEIVVSCDGVFQQSYEQYRIGGEVQQVIDFMKAIPKTNGGRKQTIVWKYILFEFNDSDEEILAAQRLAHSLEIDMLMFVFTHSRFKSMKYRSETVSTLPIHFPNVTTNLTTQLLQLDLESGSSVSESKARSYVRELWQVLRGAKRRLQRVME
ncbi:MAG: radical SAM protein [Nitrospirota bacterium]